LIVDDDLIQRDVTSKLIEKLGYQATTAESGEKAINTLKEHPQDMLVLDMIMPGGIDGTETLRRALEIDPSLRAIIVSGYAESKSVKEALRLGASAFVRKPLTLESISQAVRNALDSAPKMTVK